VSCCLFQEQFGKAVLCRFLSFANRSNFRFERAVSRVLLSRNQFRDGDHFSRMVVADHLKRPTRSSSDAGHISDSIWPFSGWGLPCLRCRHRSGALLPHHFTLTSNGNLTTGSRRGAVSFLWHFPWGCPRSPLATTLPCGARTFLPDGFIHRSGHPARSKRENSSSS